MRYHGANQISPLHFVKRWLQKEVRLSDMVQLVGFTRSSVCMNYIKKKYYKQYKEEIGLSQIRSLNEATGEELRRQFFSRERKYFSTTEIGLIDAKLFEFKNKLIARTTSKTRSPDYNMEFDGLFWHCRGGTPNSANALDWFFLPKPRSDCYGELWFDFEAYTIMSSIPPKQMQKPPTPKTDSTPRGTKALDPTAPEFIPSIAAQKSNNSQILLERIISDIPKQIKHTRQVELRSLRKHKMLTDETKKRLNYSFVRPIQTESFLPLELA